MTCMQLPVTAYYYLNNQKSAMANIAKSAKAQSTKHFSNSDMR